MLRVGHRAFRRRRTTLQPANEGTASDFQSASTVSSKFNHHGRRYRPSWPKHFSTVSDVVPVGGSTPIVPAEHAKLPWIFCLMAVIGSSINWQPCIASDRVALAGVRGFPYTRRPRLERAIYLFTLRSCEDGDNTFVRAAGCISNCINKCAAFGGGGFAIGNTIDRERSRKGLPRRR
jgi:hypothetical protein